MTINFRSNLLIAAVAAASFAGLACEVIIHVGKPGGGNGPGDEPDAGTGFPPDGSRPFPADAQVPPMGTLPPPHPSVTSATPVDLVFVIDDSYSMQALQTKLAIAIPDFLAVIQGVPGGMPDLHVAVVSTSLGAGAYANVPGCQIGSAGDQGGRFQQPPACTALHQGERFVSTMKDPSYNYRINNFDGSIMDVVQCMVQLGDGGCGFEHPFASLQLALTKAYFNDSDNGGFLRDDALLAVVMLTNEDDCSVPGNSGLFDPRVQTLHDVAPPDNPTLAGQPLGGLRSYRCNEFGHLCGGVAPPHLPPSSPLTLMECVSKEDGVLQKVEDLRTFLFQIKPNHPERIFVAALAGPPGPYTVGAATVLLNNGTMENQPQIQHSCALGTGEYGDPAVRVKAWTDAFGGNGLFTSICQDDYRATMTAIAQALVGP